MIRKRHLALGNKGLAVNSIQMLLLQLAPNAGFSKKVYTVVLAVVAVVLMVVAVVLYKCFFLVSSSLSLLDVETIWKLVELQEEDAGRVSRG